MTRTLTDEMRKALRETVLGIHIQRNKSTIAGLLARGFIDPTGALTHEGWKRGVALLPLNEQCQLMGIALEQIRGIEFGSNPEYAAWRYFSSLGYIGGYCEGGPILLLIRAAALDILTELNTFSSRQDACSRFTEAQLTIHQKHSNLIQNAIRSTDADRIASGFSEIYTSLMIQESYPGLSAQAMVAIYHALGNEKLAQITAAIMEAPYNYRAGWPDITMTNGEQLLWAEVKTTDRLHMSQISTIHRMKPLLPGTIRVVQLA